MSVSVAEDADLLDNNHQIVENNGKNKTIKNKKSSAGASVSYFPIMSSNPPEFAQSKEYGLKFGDGVRIFLVVTMYNEGREELDLTLKGIGANIKYLCEKTGVKDFWKEFVVCIVSDGRMQAKQDTLDYLTEKGMCSLDKMEKAIEESKDAPITVHLFESVVKLQTVETVNEYYPPMQVMFALKEKNAGKINSHWWFYMAFASVIKPDYCFVRCFILLSFFLIMIIVA
jgi:cellulose synthase/poly-beta-1,6-N-acetylglucosamine synthase-like glycosyltransferase